MRILMTGATSGIGLETAKTLISRGDVELVVAARSLETAPDAIKSKGLLVPVRLESLASVRALTNELQSVLPFDRLVLNAGVQCTTAMRSDDGFEFTFAVNHLAHYLLARLLALKLEKNGRIIFTASGTHDPEKKTGIPAPRHAQAAWLAHPSNDPQLDESPMTAGRRAYSTSKLCNIMTARELARRLGSIRPDLAVMAYDPGFTPGTGLARNYPGLVGAIFKYIMPLMTPRSDSVSTPANSGRLLAELVTAPNYQSARGQYYVMHGTSLRPRDPSILALDNAACAKLWDDSAGLVGLPRDM